MSEQEPELAQDMLHGADEIAEYLFGDKMSRRKIYHLVATSRLPTFKLGSMICARKSAIRAWIEIQEKRHANDNNPASKNSVRNGKV